MRVRVPVDIYVDAESASEGRLVVSQALENACLPNGEKVVFSTDDAEEVDEFCEECGETIPDGNRIANKWHHPSCSLYDKDEA